MLYTGKGLDLREGVSMVRDLQSLNEGLDDKLKDTSLSLFKDRYGSCDELFDVVVKHIRTRVWVRLMH